MTYINNEDLSIAKLEGWPDIKARLSPSDVPVQSLSREELNLCEVVEDVALQAIRRVQCDFKPSTIPNFPIFVKSNTQETTTSKKKVIKHTYILPDRTLKNNNCRLIQHLARTH